MKLEEPEAACQPTRSGPARVTHRAVVPISWLWARYNVSVMLASDIDASVLRRFTVEEYHRMAEAGVFDPTERVELIRGVIRTMSPKGRRHVIAVSKAVETFVLGVVGRARVYVQDPMPSDALQSEPEPDLLIVSSPDPEAYGTAEATPLLVIEVADSSLEYDRNVKAPLYAEAGVPEYWLVNLVNDVLEVYREPEGKRYSSRITLRADDMVRPLAWADLEISVRDLLP